MTTYEIRNRHDEPVVGFHIASPSMGGTKAQALAWLSSNDMTFDDIDGAYVCPHTGDRFYLTRLEVTA